MITYALVFMIGLLAGQWLAGFLYGKQIEALSELIQAAIKREIETP
ncbi:MAG: hypothetical protein ACYDHF_06210 [Candidatus Cryosericum sp.]